jgi:Spy/CpxP family protein refolding chaperone
MNGSRGPSPILAAVVLLLVGAVGVLGGVVLDRAVLRHRIDRGWAAHGGLLGPPNRELRRHLRERIEAHMAEELDLSDSQREQVAIVLERQEERLAVVMGEARPQIDQILEETHRQLLEILTPEQRRQLDERWRAGGWRHRLLRPDSARGT